MQKRAAIIGAGFSGLTTAYYLNKRGWQVEIFEASAQAGGLLSTRQTRYGLVESAANGLLNSALLESLSADIGCALIATKQEARNRYIVRDGQAKKWPLTIVESAQLAFAAAKYFSARALVAPKKFESLRSWGQRVLGANASKYTIETAVQGVYAMPTDQQSATLTLKTFFSSKVAAAKPRMRGTVAPRGGMSLLIGKLESALIERGVKFHFNSRLDGLPYGFQASVVAVSARDAAQLLRSTNDPRMQALEAIQMQGLTSVTAFWPKAAAGLQGFGCLFPQGDGHSALGVLMNNFIFENRASDDAISETWIFSGSEASDDALLKMIKDERNKIGQPAAQALSFHVTRWPHALPRYDRELEANLPKILGSEAKPYLVGNYLGEIGLKNLLARAYKTAEQIDKECGS